VRGNNKYYLGQLLVKNNGGGYYAFFKWGRVGYSGQNKLEPHHSFAAAKKSFSAKYVIIHLHAQYG
jgi:predicted DNA-binding WGR domain protein